MIYSKKKENSESDYFQKQNLFSTMFDRIESANALILIGKKHVRGDIKNWVIHYEKSEPHMFAGFILPPKKRENGTVSLENGQIYGTNRGENVPNVIISQRQTIKNWIS